MKNLKHYVLGALTMSAALAFTACTSENELAKPSEDVKGFYLRLSLEGEQQTRTQIKDEPQEDATMEESKVTTGTLFLFQGDDKKFQKRITAADWNTNPSQGTQGTTNVIAVSVSNVDPNVEYSVYFLANDDQAELDVAGDPLNHIYTATTPFAGKLANANAFVMFNQNDPTCEANQYKVVFTNANKSKDNPAQINGNKAIKVERLVARVDKPQVTAEGITSPTNGATPDQQDAQAKVQGIRLDGYALSNLPVRANVMQRWGDNGVLMMPTPTDYFNAYDKFGDATKLGDVQFGNADVNYVFENRGTLDGKDYTAMYMKCEVTLKPEVDGGNADFADGTFYRYDHKIYTSLQSIINSIGGTNPFGANVTVEQLLRELHKNENGGCDATEEQLSQFRKDYQIEVFHKGFCYYNVPVEAQNQKFPGYFTTLRNTIYKITVKNIFNVGTDVPNGNPDDKQPNYYMQVSVDVNPWVLKAYEIDLK